MSNVPWCKCHYNGFLMVELINSQNKDNVNDHRNLHS
jgi:hypothetical protein